MRLLRIIVREALGVLRDMLRNLLFAALAGVGVAALLLLIVWLWTGRTP